MRSAKERNESEVEKVTTKNQKVEGLTESSSKGSTKQVPSLLPKSRFLGRGCDEALFSEKKGGGFSEKGEGIQ